MPEMTTTPRRARLDELLRWAREHADATGRLPVAVAFEHADAEDWDLLAADGHLRQDGPDLVLTSPAETAKEDAALRALQSIWSERTLSTTARAVATAVTILATDGENAPTIRQLASMVSASRSAVKAALAELEAAGLLTRAPRTTESGSTTATAYNLPALGAR